MDTNWRDALRPRPLVPQRRPRQSVALQDHSPCAATTERGHPRSPINMRAKCAQVARKGLTRLTGATNWRDALRSRPLVPQRRPRQSVALQDHRPCVATTERGPPRSQAVRCHDGAWPSKIAHKHARKSGTNYPVGDYRDSQCVATRTTAKTLLVTTLGEDQ